MDINPNSNTTQSPEQMPLCPVCHNPLILRIARSHKTLKPFLMLVCGSDARHFRGFIGDRDYVNQVLKNAQSKQSEEPH